MMLRVSSVCPESSVPSKNVIKEMLQHRPALHYVQKYCVHHAQMNINANVHLTHRDVDDDAARKASFFFSK